MVAVATFVLMFVAWAGMFIAWRKQQKATAIYRRRFREGITLIEQMDANRRALEAVNADLAMQAELLLGELHRTADAAAEHMIRRERALDATRDVAGRMREQLDVYRQAEQQHREEVIEQHRGELVSRLKRDGRWRGGYKP